MYVRVAGCTDRQDKASPFGGFDQGLRDAGLWRNLKPPLCSRRCGRNLRSNYRALTICVYHFSGVVLSYDWFLPAVDLKYFGVCATDPGPF